MQVRVAKQVELERQAALAAARSRLAQELASQGQVLKLAEMLTRSITNVSCIGLEDIQHYTPAI